MVRQDFIGEVWTSNEIDMKLHIEIDPSSGFCNGVIGAVEKAEKKLKECSKLYSLGAIVHNNSELDRLNKIGLEVIDIEQMKQLHNTTVLIRAHGEPPTTYKVAKENNINLIDCTCPVVLKLQERIYALRRWNRWAKSASFWKKLRVRTTRLWLLSLQTKFKTSRLSAKV